MLLRLFISFFLLVIARLCVLSFGGDGPCSGHSPMEFLLGLLSARGTSHYWGIFGLVISNRFKSVLARSKNA